MTNIGQNSVRTRQLNRKLLLSCILQAGPQSRIGLAEYAQLTPGAITHLTSDLLSEGLLQEVGESVVEETARPGRRSTLLGIVAQSRMVLGIHLMPERIIMALVDLLGSVNLKRTYPVSEGTEPEEVIRQIIGAGIRLIRESPAPVLGVGVAVAGIVNGATGQVIRMRAQGWERIALRERLAGAFGIPTVLDHNVRAMALSEVLFGAGRDRGDLLFLHVGRSVAAGLVIGGRLLSGGSLGHTSLGQGSGARCWCGRHGCLENLVSEPALVSGCGLAEDDSPVRRLISSPECEPALRAAGHLLGQAVTNALTLLDIGRVVLGGALLRAGTPYREALEEGVRHGALLTSGRRPEVLYSEFSRNVGVQGAGALALQEFAYSAAR